MSGRPSAATEAALRAVARGSTVLGAAAKHGIAPSTLRRALRRSGIPPLPQPTGPRQEKAK